MDNFKRSHRKENQKILSVSFFYKINLKKTYCYSDFKVWGTQPTFSYFDVGSEGAGNQEPERFYHGFVLGLIADQTDIYEIRSNRESGFGRYDVMMVPKEREKTKIPAIILEFKVKNNKKEQTLEENSTVSTSADQRKKL